MLLKSLREYFQRLKKWQSVRKYQSIQFTTKENQGYDNLKDKNPKNIIKSASAQEQHQHDRIQCVQHSLDLYYVGYTRQSKRLSKIVQDHCKLQQSEATKKKQLLTLWKHMETNEINKKQIKTNLTPCYVTLRSKF